jgi:hypothetical protein
MKLPCDYTTLTTSERRLVREAYIRLQEDLCIYCGENLHESSPKRITDKAINLRLFPPHFLKHPIHLQHNHNTGMTEGAIHAYCNAVLWQYHGR